MSVFQFLKQGLHMHTQFLHLHYIVHFLKKLKLCPPGPYVMTRNSWSQDLSPDLRVRYSFLPKSSQKFLQNYSEQNLRKLQLKTGFAFNIATGKCF